MNFLIFDFLRSWLSSVKDTVIGTIYHSLRSLFYYLSSYIYRLIGRLYTLFEGFCRGRLLDDEILKTLSTRVGLVLGVLMLFYVILSFVKMLVDPDTLTDNNKGAVGIIKRVVIVIVMLGISQFVFNTLYFVQQTVVANHVISRIFLPGNVKTENFGNALAAELFTTFYSVDERLVPLKNDDNSVAIIDGQQNTTDLQGKELVKGCIAEFGLLKRRIYEKLDFELGNDCLNLPIGLNRVTSQNAETGEETVDEYEGEEIYIMSFDSILMIGFGIFAVYILVSYCISVGVRMVTLALLEIVSPMAFVSYLAPKEDTMFKRWLKLYSSVYLDAFIRIAIINFAVFLISAMLSVNNYSSVFYKSVGVTETTSTSMKILVELFLIVSILTFAKKAPDMIKDLFPNAASKLGLGGWHFKDMVGGNIATGLGRTSVAVGTGAAIGLLGGGMNSAKGAWNRTHNPLSAFYHFLGGTFGGALGGAAHGIDNGVHSKNAFGAFSSARNEQRLRNYRTRQAAEAGSTFHGRAISSLEHVFGISTAAVKETQGVQALEDYTNEYAYMKEQIHTSAAIKQMEKEYEFLQYSGADYDTLKKKREAIDAAEEAQFNNILEGKTDAFDSDKDASLIANLNASRNKMDMLSRRNRGVFGQAGIDFKKIKNLGDLKTSVGNATQTANNISKSASYAAHQADDQFAWFESNEKEGKMPLGTGKK